MIKTHRSAAFQHVASANCLVGWAVAAASLRSSTRLPLAGVWSGVPMWPPTGPGEWTQELLFQADGVGTDAVRSGTSILAKALCQRQTARLPMAGCPRVSK